MVHPAVTPTPPAGAPSTTAPPIDRAARRRIRRTGAIVGLLLPASLGIAAWWTLRGSDGAGRGVGGFVLALLAAPLLPAFGAPLRSGSGAVTAAVAASAGLWFLLGAFAAQRATRVPTAGWARFWGELLWLAACVWLGAVLAVVAANLVLGRVLL